MIDYIEIIRKNPCGFLTTQDGSGVRSRMLSAFFTEGDRMYFVTSKNKAVYAQLLENPNVAFSTYLPGYNPVLTIYGNVRFIDDMDLKARIMADNPSLKHYYAKPDNPIYILFRIEVSEVDAYTHTEGKKSYVV